MAAALVQKTVAANFSGTTIVFTFSGTPADGSMIWLGVMGGDNNPMSVSSDTFGDTGGTAWSAEVKPTFTGAIGRAAMFYRKLGTSVSGNTATLTLQNGSYKDGFMAEISGVSAIDGTAVGQAMATTVNPTSGTAITTTAAGYVVGVCFTGSGELPTADTGYTRQGTTTGLEFDAWEDQVTSAAGSFTPSWINANARTWIALGMAFKVPGGGGTAYTSAIAAALSFSGLVMKATRRPYAASLSSSGVVVKRAARAQSAALSFAGVVIKLTGKSLSAAVSTAGALTRRCSRAMSSAVSFVGSALKRTARSLAAAVSFTGAAVTSSVRMVALSGAVSFTGAIVRRTGKALSASLSVSATIARVIYVTRSSALSFAISFSAGHALILQVLSASLAFSGTVSKRTGRAFSASASFIGSLLAAMAAALTGLTRAIWVAAPRLTKWAITERRTDWRIKR